MPVVIARDICVIIRPQMELVVCQLFDDEVSSGAMLIEMLVKRQSVLLGD